MKILNLFRKIGSGIYFAINRFPEAIIFSTLTAILAIINIHSPNSNDTMQRIQMISALGIPISLCLRVIYEKISKKIIFLLSGYVIGITVLISYYFFLLQSFNTVSVTRYIAINLALYLAFIFIPYLYNKSNFEYYVIKLLTRFFITVIYAEVLHLGLTAILFAIDKLFSLNVSYRIYLDIWVLVLGVFGSCFYLGGIPSKELAVEKYNYPKFLKVLIIYILMPLISTYSIILYAYLGKILFTRNWPIGMVTNLVLWYSAISVATIFLIWPISKENKWSKYFTSWYPIFSLPLLVMMFISLGIRINAYGFTENRYFVGLLGLWVLCSMLYFIFTKSKKNIILPLSLSIITILSVIGPWSAYSVSKSSQNMRLENILSKYNMIKNNSIVKSDKKITSSDENNITSILEYFKSSHNFSDVKYLPKNFSLNDMKSVFGFEPIHDKVSNYFSFYSTNELIDIKGYDYLFTSDSYSKTNISTPKVDYNFESTEFKVSNQNTELYKNKIGSFAEKVYNKYKYKDISTNIPLNDMTFYDDNEKVKVKIILYRISGNNQSVDEKMSFGSIEFKVLIKMK